MPVLQSNTSGYQLETTPTKLIKRALRILAVIDPDEALEPKQLEDGLEALNQMLDSWNTEESVVPSKILTSTSITTRNVTIGPGADVDVARPPKLVRGQVFVSISSIDYELGEMTFEEYGQRADLVISGRPSRFYYDAASPTGTINFDLTPDQTYTLNVYTWKLLAQIALAQINETLILEPGFARAIVYNLALDLADEFGVTASENAVLLSAVHAVEHG